MDQEQKNLVYGTLDEQRIYVPMDILEMIDKNPDIGETMLFNYLIAKKVELDDKIKFIKKTPHLIGNNSYELHQMETQVNILNKLIVMIKTDIKV